MTKQALQNYQQATQKLAEAFTINKYGKEALPLMIHTKRHNGEQLLLLKDEFYTVEDMTRELEGDDVK